MSTLTVRSIGPSKARKLVITYILVVSLGCADNLKTDFEYE